MEEELHPYEKDFGKYIPGEDDIEESFDTVQEAFESLNARIENKE